MWPRVSGTSTLDVRVAVGVPAERVDDRCRVAEDVGQRELLGGPVVEEVLEILVVEHQDLLGLDTQHVSGRRVDGDTAGRATLVGTHGSVFLLWVMPPGRSSGRGGQLVDYVA
jgi:hypothetical protein